jgi:hypothetical protein
MIGRLTMMGIIRLNDYVEQQLLMRHFPFVGIVIASYPNDTTTVAKKK